MSKHDERRPSPADTGKSQEETQILEPLHTLEDILMTYKLQVSRYYHGGVLKSQKEGDKDLVALDRGKADGFETAHYLVRNNYLYKAIKEMDKLEAHHRAWSKDDTTASKENCMWHSGMSESLLRALAILRTSAFFHKIKPSLPSKNEEVFLRNFVYEDELRGVIEALKDPIEERRYQGNPLDVLTKYLDEHSNEFLTHFYLFREYQKDGKLSEIGEGL